MPTTDRRSLALPLLTTLCAVLAAACAEERPPIDRVQPYALPKTFFLGEDLVDPGDDPEFWTIATLIDVGYGATQDSLFTSTWAQPVSRIRWQVTEELLIGRLAYERIEGSDGKGVGGPTEDGVIAVAFEIESHFDIVYAYNSTTGERLNILEENTTDRPWYEREYMRVDWSKNLNVDSYDFDTLSMIGIYDGITYEALSYDVTDPEDPHAPVFDLDGGYFDVTNKAFAEPQTIDISHFGWGIDAFPACWLEYDFLGGSWPGGSCSPAELTVRHSFRRVEDHDYEPVHWDGYRFQAYGAFYVERFGYARNYGMSDDKWYRFAARYPLWDRSHYYDDPQAMTGWIPCFTTQTTPFGSDPNRDEDQNGTADECEAAGAGSRCDTFKQRCTLPYAQRTPRPIAWYYSTGSLPELFEPTRLAAHEWDVGLRSAIRVAQYTECKRLGGEDCAERFPVWFGQQDDNEDAVRLALEVDNCREGLAYPERGRDPAQCRALADELGAARGLAPGVIEVAKMEQQLVLCHSPVEANDPEVCGGPRLPERVTAAHCFEATEDRSSPLWEVCHAALNTRRGDLRYHQVHVIAEPQSAAPWGIYTDAEDPLTGETVAAAINAWAAVNDSWSQGVIDRIRYIKGELATDEITDGEYVRDWVEAARAATGGTGMAPRVTREELDRRLAAAVGRKELPEPPQVGSQAYQQGRALKRELAGVKASHQAASSMRPIYAARMQQARGSEHEAELMTPMIQQLTGVDGLPLSGAVMDRASLLRGANPSLQRDLQHRKRLAMAERGACVLEEAPAPLGLTGLADVLEEKFGRFDATEDPDVQQARAERMRRYLAAKVHYSVIVHEMGHSIGMRHNFVSSADPWNYRPQYWQLRTRDGQVTERCDDLVSDGSSCVGPRYFDPLSEEERENLIWMFMQSSVMDYPGEPTQDMLGLGAYDFAAARMFYGDAVAVYADESYNAGSPRSAGAFDKMDSFGGIIGFTWYYGDYELHYSDLQQYFQKIQDCQPVDPQVFKPAGWNDARDGVWHPTFDGHIVKVNGQYTRCRQQPVDYVPWESLRKPTEQEFSGWYWGAGSIDPEGRVRVPYGFASDGWANLGNIAVYTSDNGADPYELFDFLITQQEVNHIFDNYRRGRQSFSVRGASGRTLWRYNEKIRDAVKGLTLMRNIYDDYALAIGYGADTYWPLIAPYWFKENTLAAAMAFDHFTRLLERPEAGPHQEEHGDPVLRSSRDPIGRSGDPVVTIPNGATGYFGDIAAGGKLVENQLAEDQGDYDSDFVINCGSYYDKVYTAMLMTESVDNYISSSRQDFVDPRYRATSIADLFPDGYRRWLANNLTGDDWLKGPRIATSASGTPLVDANGYPAQPMGFPSWWGNEPELCFPRDGTNVCATYGASEVEFPGSAAPEHTRPVDPQVGWEQQKFLIAWTMLYLPENQKQRWLDMLRVWELGKDADPGFDNRIEFHHPEGKVYVAKTFGKEQVFGKTVQKGIAARVLQHANELLVAAYETVPGPDVDGDGLADWYLPYLDPGSGKVNVLFDPTTTAFDDEWYIYPEGVEGCNPADSSQCQCGGNRFCQKLRSYVEVPFFMRQALDAYGLADPDLQGIW